MDHGDDTSRAGSPPREAGGEPESCFGEPEESVSQSAESSSPEGSPLDRPRKQACRHSLHEEAVKVAVLNLQVACRIPVGTQSKKARSVEDVVVDGFLKVAVKFPDAFDPWLSPKAQGLINSTSEALAATASTAEGQESRPRSSTLPRTKNRGFKMPALPRNKPVPDRVAGAIHAAFVGEPGHPRPPVFPSTLAVRFNQVCGKGEQGGQPSDLTTTLVSPGQLVRVSYNQAVDGDKHKAKPSPAAQQEGLAIVVSAPLYGGGPRSPLTLQVLWVWQRDELLAHAQSKGVHVTSAGPDYVQLRPTSATPASPSDVEKIIKAIFKPPSKDVQVVVVSDILDQVPAASIVQVLPKPRRRSLLPEVVGGVWGDEEKHFVYSHECTFQQDSKKGPGNLIISAVELDLVNVLNDLSEVLLDNPCHASELTKSLFAKPILGSIQALAKLLHRSPSSSCSFSLPMPLSLFAYLAPSVPPGPGAGVCTRVFRRAMQDNSPQDTPPPPLVMEAIYPCAAALAEFMGSKKWDRLFIREDCSVGNWKLQAYGPFKLTYDMASPGKAIFSCLAVEVYTDAQQLPPPELCHQYGLVHSQRLANPRSVHTPHFVVWRDHQAKDNTDEWTYDGPLDASGGISAEARAALDERNRELREHPPVPTFGTPEYEAAMRRTLEKQAERAAHAGGSAL